MGDKTSSETKLREAMDRLLAGTPKRTDGRLIKENLYREAAVSRATMNRARSVLDEWERRVDGTQPRDKDIEALKGEIVRQKAETAKLHRRVRELEEQLTIASTAVAELHVANQLLRDEDPTRGVAPLRRSQRRPG